MEISDVQGSCEVDAKALEESLLNVLEHALESCRLDGLEKTHLIRFALRWEADDALFIVEDDGIGMDRETLERVFSLHLASQGAGRAGLGLFTANKVIERHRGVIEISSEPRQGTSIRIRIPRA